MNSKTSITSVFSFKLHPWNYVIGCSAPDNLSTIEVFLQERRTELIQTLRDIKSLPQIIKVLSNVDWVFSFEVKDNFNAGIVWSR